MDMDGKKTLATLLLIGGIAALFYINFGDPKDTRAPQTVNVEVSALEK
jgi:hypothetical protein